MNTGLFPRQRGMALVIALVMLLLLTVMVSSAFTLSNINLASVGNQQWRSEAQAAAEVAIEQVVGSPFTLAPVAESIAVDLNRDDVTDYVVQIARPECVRASLASAVSASSLTLVGMANSTWNTVWELVATVDDPTTGASVRVRTGVRILLSEARKNAVCP